jgi:hypothetical protein
VTGVAHLSSALYLKGKFPRAPLHLLVLAAAAPDLVWAAMNLAPNPGRAPLEIARVDRPFLYIGSLDLVLEPYSHALFSVLVVGGLLAGLGYLAFRDRQVVVAVLLAVLGHWALDYLVHDADLLLSPFGDRARVGPGLGLDALHPERGLNATQPLIGFALQALVVAGSAATFLHAFPAVRVRRPRLWFTVGLGALVLLSLPVFIPGALTAMTRSTKMFVVAALSEKALAWVVIAFLAARVVGPSATASPFRAREDDTARRFALQLHQTLAAVCLLLVALYLWQSAWDAKAHPALGRASLLLALGDLVLALALLRHNPAMLWPTLLLAFVVGPWVRICWPGGSLAGALTVAELGAGLLAMYLIRNLLRRDVRL